MKFKVFRPQVMAVVGLVAALCGVSLWLGYEQIAALLAGGLVASIAKLVEAPDSD